MADEVTTTKSAKASKAVEAEAPVQSDATAGAVDDAIKNLREALIADGMSEGTADALLHALQPNQINVVGNLADLQRMGAMMADKEAGDGGTLEEAFVTHPEANIDESGEVKK